MAAADQKKRLLKAKIAVALRDELGRVPTQEEIEQVFLLTRVMDQAVLGLPYRRKEQRQTGQLAIFQPETPGRMPRPPMLIGYARVSTLDQTLALQQDALTKAGCQRLFTDTASSSLPQSVFAPNSTTSPTLTGRSPNSLNKIADPDRTKISFTQS